MSALTDSRAWRALHELWRAHAGILLPELFAADPDRAARYTRRLGGVTLDVSKTHLTPSVFDGLMELARQERVLEWRDAMFAGEPVNHTEDRAALHAALRTPELGALTVDGLRVDEAVADCRRQMGRLVEGVASGELRAGDGGSFTDVVNIGIGGSDLGPRLVCEALADRQRAAPRVHFLANLDPDERSAALADVDPARTLFIVASKSFTTLETLTNARAVHERLRAKLGTDDAVGRHFVAVTSRPDRAREWGIGDDRIFPLWDWVGGRYSVWSAVGLPVAFAFGMDGFEALQAGGAEVDRHFRDTPERENLPLWLALVGIWYRNFGGAASHVVLPYAQRLKQLPDYLQQLEMESNGKSVDRDGGRVDYGTAPAIWGQVGTTGQHAVFQWLHQGTQVVPCDFIVTKAGAERDADRDAMAANAFGQMAALLAGRTTDSLRREGVAEWLRPHRAMTGDRPTTTFLLDELSPRTLGNLIALYEHKVFCQAMIWRINPFDQWGVERGKELARALGDLLAGDGDDAGWDGSTRSLVRRYRQP